MSIALSPAFLATSLVVALIPGTGVLYTISVSLTRKMSASVAAAIGCTLGIVPHIAACALGLSALMNAGARAFMAIRYLGAAYLLYLAWKTWVTAGELKAGDGGDADGYFRIAAKGVALNLLNPKLTLFFFAFIPQFVRPDSARFGADMAAVSAAFMAVTLFVFVLYGALARVASGYLLGGKGAMKRVERCFALAFAALAAKLAFGEK